MDWITRPEAGAALATLTALEILPGIDQHYFHPDHFPTAARISASSSNSIRQSGCSR